MMCCYFFGFVCLLVSIMLVGKGISGYIAFLTAALIFGFIGNVFETSNQELKHKWEALAHANKALEQLSKEEKK